MRVGLVATPSHFLSFCLFFPFAWPSEARVVLHGYLTVENDWSERVLSAREGGMVGLSKQCLATI